MKETIVAYLVPVSLGLTDYCDTCETSRVVWVAIVDGGARVTCCNTCKNVLKRETR